MTLNETYNKIRDYRTLLDLVTHKEIYFSESSEKKLFKYVGESFFDFIPSSSTPDNRSSRSPFTMTEFMSNANMTNGYFDRTRLKAGYATYTANDFPKLKTLISYYVSDINF